MQLDETVQEVGEKLIVLSDILRAMSSHAEHGGIASCEILNYISDIVFDCNKTLQRITSTN